MDSINEISYYLNKIDAIKHITDDNFFFEEDSWQVHCVRNTIQLSEDKKASIRWQDSARRQFQAGLRDDVGL